jgi:elongation of very long chain fatty acids protein 4
MYVYYFVSLHTKNIPWKSALTMSQMVQFVCMNAQAGHLLYYNCESFPRNITMAYLYYIMTLLFLFAKFFVSSYITGGKKTKNQVSNIYLNFYFVLFNIFINYLIIYLIF